MKYKVGERVKLKINQDWCQEAVQIVEKLIDRIGTIKEVQKNEYACWDYRIEGVWFGWDEKDIECLEEDLPKYTKFNRFEIMDI